MKSCSTGGCKTKKTVLTILSLALGLGMLIFGLMKFGAPIEMQEWIGGAAHQAGLTFLSISTWFWIATIGEIIAGILLLIGCSKGKKAGALLTIIIMLVALNSTGWVDAKAYVFAAVALVVLFVGGGKSLLNLCGKKCGKGSCEKGACKTKQEIIEA